MNLRINLLRPDEVRSASVLSLRFMTRLALGLLPTILVLWLAAHILKLMRESRELDALKAQWATEEPALLKAREAHEDMRAFLDLDAELDGWLGSRMAWHPALAQIVAVVPPTIQIQQLNLTHEIQAPNGAAPGRVFSLQLSGKATDANAEAAIERFWQTLRALDFFETLEPARADRDTAADAHPDDRVFTIKGRLHPRRLR